MADAASVIVPSPPRLSGDYASDWLILADYFQDFYNGALSFPSETVDPNNLTNPGNASIATAQLTANAAYNFCLAINEALARAGVTGFPINPPTS